MDGFLAAIGLTKGATIGGFFGAMVSLKFLGKLNIWQGCLTVFAGTVSAAYVTPLAMLAVELNPKAEGSTAFLIGVFGMLIGSAVAKAIPEWVQAGKAKIFGGQ